MTSMNDDQRGNRYWPFPVGETDRLFPELAEKIEFLEGVYSDGFKAYWALPEQSIYGASSKTRSGMIVQRGRKNRWEFRLDENIEQRLTAFITDFEVAGTAVRAWLNGRSVNDILEDIKEYLTLLSGLKTSYTVYDKKDEKHWPFTVSEEERQRPGVAKKIEFLESVYSDGFEVYRVHRESKRERYVAKSQSRLGFIVEWTPEKGKEIFWEFGVSESGRQGFTAFLTDFKVAGTALRAWLNGRSATDILEDIKEYLTVPSGCNESFILYKAQVES
jgi:hypothetical protein